MAMKFDFFTILSTVLCTVAVFGPVLCVPLLAKGPRLSKVPPRVSRKVVRRVTIGVLVGSWVGTAVLTYLGHYPRLDWVMSQLP